MFEDPFAPKRGRKKSTNPLGGSVDFGLGPKKDKKNSSKREHVPMIWRDKILMRQKNKCAGKDCAKLHNGKKLMVNNRSDFDHIKPLALGGKHTLSNLQALCPGCHRLKTREDKYNISQAKKRKKKKTNDSLFGENIFGTQSKRKKSKNPYDLGF